MRRFFSILFLVLVFFVFLFDLFISIGGGLHVDEQMAELEARGAGGHELLGVGLDVLILCILILSAVGVALSLISLKLARHRTLRIVSGVLCPSFLLPGIISALILAL